jgi:SM-20-related protein
MTPPVLTLPGVLSAADLARVLDGLARAAAAPSTVNGGHQSPARRSSRFSLEPAVDALLRSRLEAVRPRLEAHFAQSLGGLEPLQVLRYGPGDYFVAHQDGATPLIWDDTRHRRVSVSLLLSDPADWAGGELVFHGPKGERWAATAPAGDAVAFRSETTHEVTPLQAGERLSAAAWFRAPGT